jgi:hypothetical protein
MVTRSLCLLFLLALSASAQTPRIPPPESVNRNGLIGFWLSDGYIAGGAINPLLALSITRNNTGSFAGANDWLSYSGRAQLANPAYGLVSLGTNDAVKPQLITVSAWVWRVGDSGFKQALNYSINQGGIELGIVNDRAYFAANVSGWSGTPNNAAAAFPPNRWTHIVGVYDGARYAIYVDGVFRIATLRSGVITWAAGGDVRIGKPDGRVSQVRIYNRALSADEIKRIYRGLQ